MESQDNVKAFYGKDNSKWSRYAPTRGKTVCKNIIKVLPGLKGKAKSNHIETPLEAWKVMISEDIIEQIVLYRVSQIRCLALASPELLKIDKNG